MTKPARHSRARSASLVAGLAVTASYATLHWLGRTYGSTPTERRMPLQGDSLVPSPRLSITHAITIDAPPERIWPWLVQVGWHRGGWYTARWVDQLLFPANAPSADRIIPELQHLVVGDFVPDGPPEAQCKFVVEELVPERVLVLHSTSHLPLAWRERLGATIDWTWTFLLRPLDDDRTRFLFRWRATTSPWWLTAGCVAVIVPADYVMSRDMLRGVRSRAEGQPGRAWSRKYSTT